MAVDRLRCRECGTEVPGGPVYVCEACLGPLETAYDFDALRRLPLRARIEAGPKSIWRYADLLPVPYDPVVDLSPGLTPLVAAPRLGEALGLRHLYIKNDSVNPTWSFKDRSVSIGTAAARRFGYDVLACASTGNLAHSVAAHAARAGMRACVFVHAGIERARSSRRPSTARLWLRSTAATMTSTGCARRLVRNTSGLSSTSICGRTTVRVARRWRTKSPSNSGWRAPDAVVVPVASGNLLVKSTGFQELAELGLMPARKTRMHGAQAEGCDPVAAAFKDGTDRVRPVRPNTIAHSLAIGTPADGRYAIAPSARPVDGSKRSRMRRSWTVSSCWPSTEGIFTEPAGGVTVAVLRKLVRGGAIDPEHTTVAYITGMGLKTQEAVAGALPETVRIKPTLRAFEQAVLARLMARRRQGESDDGDCADPDAHAAVYERRTNRHRGRRHAGRGHPELDGRFPGCASVWSTAAANCTPS